MANCDTKGVKASESALTRALSYYSGVVETKSYIGLVRFTCINYASISAACVTSDHMTNYKHDTQHCLMLLESMLASVFGTAHAPNAIRAFMVQTGNNQS